MPGKVFGEQEMKLAEAFVEALKKGISAEEALSSLPPFELRRCRTYMSFARVRNRDKYTCRFHEDNLAKTPISRRLIFRSRSIFEAARRGHGLTDMHSRQALAEAVAIGRGGIWLKLTEEQLQSIRHHS